MRTVYQPILVSILFFTLGPVHSQVLDVNGDNEVGPDEALAVAEQWKGTAIRANDHNHLGQIWNGNRNPLIIRGSFPQTVIIGPAKEGQKGPNADPSAPLILENTAPDIGDLPHPDLLLLGPEGTVSAQDSLTSELHLVSNDAVLVYLDSDGNNVNQSFVVLNSGGFPAMSVQESGNMRILGTLETETIKVRTDHPSDPTNKYLSHAGVTSPDRLNTYTGNVTLDDRGEAVVQLPDYVEAFNTDFRYQLTPVGSAAPDLHVAEKIQGNAFKIAGGQPNQEISWTVSGVRNDAYAKANPNRVEQEKSVEEKGRYLHPELFGKPVEMNVGWASPEESD